MESGNTVVSLSDKDPLASASKAVVSASDYSQIEIIDPITQTQISNLHFYVETSA